MCRAYNRQHGAQFLAVMPTNLYGPGDNYDLETSHVLPALVRKIHEAKTRGEKEVVIWGSGKPRREFLHADDLADACVMLAALDDAAYAAQPDGTPQKLLDISRISALGWRPRIGLPEGIARTYRELLDAGTLP